MTHRVDVCQDLCVGCGVCLTVAPEVFRFSESGVSEVHGQQKASKANIQEAIEGCPVSCIHWH